MPMASTGTTAPQALRIDPMSVKRLRHQCGASGRIKTRSKTEREREREREKQERERDADTETPTKRQECLIRKQKCITSPAE